jgi:hypothetical protein
MLLRPLFITSFVVEDFLADHQHFGATRVAISSASSKTALGAAFLLRAHGQVEVLGLTSETNLAFTHGTGCYDHVLTYGAAGELDARPTAFVDVAGRRDVTRAVHVALGENLKYSMVVGDTHWDHVDEGGEVVGPRPTLLFAPDQIQKRRRDWGRERFEAAVGESWEQFLTNVDGWMTVVERRGGDEVSATYLDLLEGRVDPAVGFSCRWG